MNIRGIYLKNELQHCMNVNYEYKRYIYLKNELQHCMNVNYEYKRYISEE